MKRVTSILLSLLLVVSLTACGSTESGASDTLIIYFSESGNTETIANYIHDEIGGDMVQIIPTAEYPHVYEELADYAKAEQDNNERPAFEDLGVDPTSYQTVFIGYPKMEQGFR